MFGEIGIPCIPCELRSIIDSSTKDLKAVLWHNRYEFLSLLITHSLHLEENHGGALILGNNSLPYMISWSSSLLCSWCEKLFEYCSWRTMDWTPRIYGMATWITRFYAFFLRSYLKSKEYETQCHSIQGLRTRIMQGYATITWEILQTVRAETKYRFYFCQEVNAEQFEHLVK